LRDSTPLVALICFWTELSRRVIFEELSIT
jgi:hypothetical protein